MNGPDDDPLVRALRAPGTPRELAGEDAVLRAYRDVYGAPPRARRALGRLGIGTGAIALSIALGGGVAAAYTQTLPDPVQDFAHGVLGPVGVPPAEVRAPQRPAPAAGPDGTDGTDGSAQTDPDGGSDPVDPTDPDGQTDPSGSPDPADPSAPASPDPRVPGAPGAPGPSAPAPTAPAPGVPSTSPDEVPEPSPVPTSPPTPAPSPSPVPSPEPAPTPTPSDPPAPPPSNPPPVDPDEPSDDDDEATPPPSPATGVTATVSATAVGPGAVVTVRGTVTDASGAPVPGRNVRLAIRVLGGPWTTHDSKRTDGDGRVALDGPPLAENLEVRLEVGRRLLSDPVPIALRPDLIALPTAPGALEVTADGAQDGDTVVLFRLVGAIGQEIGRAVLDDDLSATLATQPARRRATYLVRLSRTPRHLAAEERVVVRASQSGARG